MKLSKVLIATGIATLAIASIAAAATFNSNLTVGSTGADVTALQSSLIAGGFSIPAGATGYFGSQTKAAVMAYQSAHGVPNTGFVGPLTRASLNGTASSNGTTVTSACPVGYTCTANPGTATNGTTVVGSTAGISTPGIPGTLATSLWSSPSDGTVVYKGQSYDVVAYKLQAAASDMAVQSVGIDFNTRLWLYASTITLKDDQGKIVGQVNNLNSSNFSELTVGSDYRITVPISGYVIKATQTRYITANVTFLSVSDRATNTGLQAISAQIRSIDGTGVTDTESVNSARTFSYQGSGAGSVVVTVDGSSPLSGLVQISTGGQTQNIPLAVYDIKSQNAPSNLRSITFVVRTTGSGKTPQDLFTQYNLKVGGQTFGAQTITANTTVNGQASTTVTFSNFGTIALAADTYLPLTLSANVQQDTNNALDGVAASTTLSVSGSAGGSSNNPSVEDQSYSTLANTSGTFISSNLTFSGSSAVLSNLTATCDGASICGTGTLSGNTTVAHSVAFSFTITAGNSSLFLASDTNAALSTTSTGFGSTASSSLPVSGVIANPPSLSGDTTVTVVGGYYVVPAGSSRQFTFQGSMNNTNGSASFKTFSVTAVNYSTTTTNLAASTINYNLQPLKVTANF